MTRVPILLVLLAALPLAASAQLGSVDPCEAVLRYGDAAAALLKRDSEVDAACGRDKACAAAHREVTRFGGSFVCPGRIEALVALAPAAGEGKVDQVALLQSTARGWRRAAVLDARAGAAAAAADALVHGACEAPPAAGGALLCKARVESPAPATVVCAITPRGSSLAAECPLRVTWKPGEGDPAERTTGAGGVFVPADAPPGQRAVTVQVGGRPVRLVVGARSVAVAPESLAALRKPPLPGAVKVESPWRPGKAR